MNNVVHCLLQTTAVLFVVMQVKGASLCPNHSNRPGNMYVQTTTAMRMTIAIIVAGTSIFGTCLKLN